MKTIITTLPIYDKLKKQCYERAKHAFQPTDLPVPIICPRHRLPSFQWKDESDGSTSVSRIEMYNQSGLVYNDSYFSSWTNDTFVTLTTVGLDINVGITNNVLASALITQSITGIAGDVIIIKGTLALTSGLAPHLYLFKVATSAPSDITDMFSGYNEYTFTLPSDGEFLIKIGLVPNPGNSNFSFTGVGIDITPFNNYFASLPSSHAITGDVYFVYPGTTLNYLLPVGIYYLKITMDNAKIYYSEWFKVDCVFGSDTALPPTADSEDYLVIDFHNDCDLGDILYHEGFTQTLWIKSEPMEITFPQEEEGIKNGEGRFVRTFARQTKKYNVKTFMIPDYMVEVFNRLKLHDTIQLTDLVGDVHDVYNLEVEHEWMGDDKYYAKAELTFDYDETFVVAGCCNNII